MTLEELMARATGRLRRVTQTTLDEGPADCGDREAVVAASEFDEFGAPEGAFGRLDCRIGATAATVPNESEPPPTAAKPSN